MRILLDMDGVVNLFDEHFVAIVEAMGYGFDWEGYNDWEIYEHVIGCKDPERLMDEVFCRMDFWMTIPPMDYAYDVLKDMNKRYEIVIATKVWRDEEPFKVVKKKWLDKYFHFFHNNEIFFGGFQKWNLEGDVIFEDKPETIQKCYQKGMITVVSDRPYNKFIVEEADFRYRSWKQVPMIMKAVERMYKA